MKSVLDNYIIGVPSKIELGDRGWCSEPDVTPTLDSDLGEHCNVQPREIRVTPWEFFWNNGGYLSVMQFGLIVLVIAIERVLLRSERSQPNKPNTKEEE